MGMLLRRNRKDVVVEPKVNGKPVEKTTKKKKLSVEPEYPTETVRQVTGINNLIRQ